MKKFFAFLLSAAMAVGTSVTAFAADSLTLNIGTDYATFEDAIAYVNSLEDVPSEITYVMNGDETITAPVAKYEPDMANGASIVNIKGSGTLTLAGVYFGKFAAEGATLNVEGITLADARKASGEASDPDPWEYTYLEFECAAANFTDVTFEEGVLISGDATFDGCTFTVEPQYYTDSNGTTFDPSKDYSDDHYALWIHNTGNVTVTNSTFKDVGYGAIKTTYNKYGTGEDLNLTVTESTFSNCGNEDTHKMVHADGADSITVTYNTIENCFLGEGETEADKLVNDKSGKAALDVHDNFRQPEEDDDEPVVEVEKDPEFASVTAKILWNGKATDSVEVKLLKNDKKSDTATLKAGKYKTNNWRHTWKELDIDEDWDIDVVVPAGYECEIDEIDENYFEITLTQIEAAAPEAEEENPNTGAC